MNNTRTPLFLMANLSSEVSKVFSSLDKGKKDQARDAQVRAESIIFQIKQFPEMKERLPEIDRLAEVIEGLTEEKNLSVHTRENTEAYFTPFVVRFFAQK